MNEGEQALKASTNGTPSRSNKLKAKEEVILILRIKECRLILLEEGEVVEGLNQPTIDQG